MGFPGLSVIVAMIGWLCAASGQGIHGGADMKVSDRALNGLRARGEGWLEPGGAAASGAASD